MLCKALDIIYNIDQSLTSEREIAICSPNFVQVGKGRDWKTVFCRRRHKKCRAEGETFFYVKHYKKLYSDQNLFLREQNFENT